MRVRISLAVVCLSALSLLNACATVAHGPYQSVPVSSSPSGADVTLDCGGRVRHIGATPLVAKLRRGADHCEITMTKEGYEPTSVVFSKSTSGWIWGNLFIGDYMLAGALVDYLDGAMYNRLPKSVQFTLAPQPEGRAAAR